MILINNLLDELLLTINCKICVLLGIKNIYGLISNKCNPCPEKSNTKKIIKYRPSAK